MQNLPHETMQHLQVECDTRTSQGMEMFVTAVSRMTRLKDLNLENIRCAPPLINPNPLFIKLFSNMKHLEKIEIRFPSDMRGTVDSAIDRLVDNNPRLTHISFYNAHVTGASLVSLSPSDWNATSVFAAFRC